MASMTLGGWMSDLADFQLCQLERYRDKHWFLQKDLKKLKEGTLVFLTYIFF